MIRGNVLKRRRAEQSERIEQVRGYVEALAGEIPIRAAVVYGSVSRRNAIARKAAERAGARPTEC